MNKSGTIIFTPNAWQSCSGSGRSAYSLATELSYRRCRVTILTYGIAASNSEIQLNPRIEVRRIPFRKNLVWIKVVIRFLVPLFILRLSFKHKNLLIFGSFPGYLVALFVAKALGMNTIFRSTMYGSDNLSVLTSRSRLRKCVLGRLDVYYPVSPIFLNDFLTVFPDTNSKMVRAWAGVDIDRFRPIEAEEKSRLRSRLGLSSNDFIIVSVGNLVSRKGYESLFNVMYELDVEFKYLILGAKNVTVQNDWHDPKEMVRIESAGKKLLGDKVHFTGWVANVEEYLRVADVYILNSHAEGLPNSLLEAMACGVVPIVPKSLGLDGFLIDNEKNGFCFNRLEEAIGILKRLVANQSIRTEISKIATQTIQEKFTLDKVAQAVMAKLK